MSGLVGLSQAPPLSLCLSLSQADSFSHICVCLLKSHVHGLTVGIRMQTVEPRVSRERTLEGFVCWHIETPAPTLATAEFPSFLWTRIVDPIPLHGH